MPRPVLLERKVVSKQQKVPPPVFRETSLDQFATAFETVTNDNQLCFVEFYLTDIN